MTRAFFLLLASCSVVEVGGEACEREEPNGYCEADEECDAADHCLVEWCHGGDGCEPVHRCTPKAHPGDWCEGPGWCASGRCSIEAGFRAGVCEL